MQGLFFLGITMCLTVGDEWNIMELQCKIVDKSGDNSLKLWISDHFAV